MSASLNRILRHTWGKYQSNKVCHVMTPGWVPIEDVLKCESIWRHDYARWPHVFLAPKGRANDQSAWNLKEANFRMTLLFKIMFHCARYGRRVREQVLAFGINKDIERTSLTCIDNKVDADTNIPDEGLLLYPVAVRAPTGHKRRIIKGRRLVAVLTTFTSNRAQHHFIVTGLFPHHQEDQPSKYLEAGINSRRSWRRSSDVHVLQPVCALGSQILDHHEER